MRDKNAYSDWRLNHLNVVLLREDLFRAAAEGLDLAFLDVLATLQGLDPRVDIKTLLSLLSRHFSYSD